MRGHAQEVSTAATSIAEHDLSDLVPNAIQAPPRAILYDGGGDRSASSSSSSAVSSYGFETANVHHPVSLIPTVSPPRYQLSLSHAHSHQSHSLSHPGSPPSRASTSFTSTVHRSARPAYSPSNLSSITSFIGVSTPAAATSSGHGRLSLDGRRGESYGPGYVQARAHIFESVVAAAAAVGGGRAVSGTYSEPGGRRSAYHHHHALPHLQHQHQSQPGTWSAGYRAQHSESEYDAGELHARSLPYGAYDEQPVFSQSYSHSVDPHFDGDAVVYPLSNAQQARITAEQYKLGVGYENVAHALPDDEPGSAGGGMANHTISEERRRERLKALEREFGRAKIKGEGLGGRKATPASIAAARALLSPTKAFPRPGDGAAEAGSSNTGSQKPGLARRTSAEHADDEQDGEDENDEKHLSFKALRARQKATRDRVNKELGVTKRGQLLTQGPRKRSALRWCQAILGLVGTISGIGGAFFTHPEKDDKPAPSGAISTYLLYVLSLASLPCSLYLFLIQPCLRRREHKASHDAAHDPTSHAHAQGAGMVLPIFTSAGGGAHGYNALSAGGGKGMSKKQRKAMKKAGLAGHFGMGNQQPMTVNLVVDPGMLGLLRAGGGGAKAPSRYDEHDPAFDDDEDEEHKSPALGPHAHTHDDDDEEDLDFEIPDSSKFAQRNRRRRVASSPLMDTMTAMRLQDRWREARRRARRMVWIDACWCVVWFAEAVFAIGHGGRCKPGSSGGWCDTYNLAISSAALLSCCFCSSLVFGLWDP